MFERATSPREAPVPLSVAAGQRIVMPGLDPVVGWIGNENSRAGQALVFPHWLLEARPTETIGYACNLPASAPGTRPEQVLPQAPGASGPQAEAAFLAASVPGGRVAIVTAGGRVGTIIFRWLRVAANASMGAVWRCCMKLYAPKAASPWTVVGNDYIFEAASGFLASQPGNLRAVLGGASFKLAHPEGRLTCFPSQSGLVTVTRISADGWVKRELLGLWLLPDRSIVARFSDGTDARIATAAATRPGGVLAA